MYDIASDLKEELGWEPLLWIANANQKSDVKAAFPEAYFQDLEDAFLGLPIPTLTDEIRSFDKDTWKSLQEYLPTLMSQMNRFGPPEHFLFDERLSFARKLLLQWHTAISKLSPDLVFFEEAPNSPYMYSLYSLCKIKKIPTVFFTSTSFATRTILKDSIERPALGPSAIPKIEVGDVPSPTQNIDKDIWASYQELKNSETFSYWYMNRQYDYDEKIRALNLPSELPSSLAQESTETQVEASSLFVRGLKALNILRWPLYYRNYMHRKADVAQAAIAAKQEAQRAEVARAAFVREQGAKSAKNIRLKYPQKPIGDFKYSPEDSLEYTTVLSRQIKDNLRASYELLCGTPLLHKDKYVYFPLHYQPERTVNPDGGVFFDYMFTLRILSESLPEGWKLYVKEHTSQFSYMLSGERGRTVQDYDEILKLHNTILIPSNADSRELIASSQAVATITGTAGWEAVILGKPILYFGYPWYQDCPGTHQIFSVQQANFILSNLTAHTASEQEILQYLATLSKITTKFIQNNWAHDPPPQSESEQKTAMVEALTWWNKEYLQAKGVRS